MYLWARWDEPIGTSIRVKRAGRLAGPADASHRPHPSRQQPAV